MRRRSVGLPGLLAATVLFAASARGAPRIACREAVYDFGSAANTGRIERAFVIRNEGDAELKIGELRACCGSSMRMDAKTIAPGSNAVASVTFSLGGRQGQQRKAFYIASNDPAQPYFQLLLVGTALGSGQEPVLAAAPPPQVAEGPFHVIPSEILLSEPAADPKPVARYVVVRSRDGQPFKILATRAPAPGMGIAVSPLPSGGFRLALTGIFPTKALDGASLVVTTDRDAAKEIPVPFRVVAAERNATGRAASGEGLPQQLDVPERTGEEGR
jgi:hypothetical protein